MIHTYVTTAQIQCPIVTVATHGQYGTHNSQSVHASHKYNLMST